MKDEDISSNESGALCPKCHNPVTAGNAFCNHCGTKIEQR
ncbi:MAG: zinc-ribbon domain-containing protein [Acutalibacteraceae bacterium]